MKKETKGIVKVVPKYTDQLKDRRWLRKRSTIVKRDKYTCTKCHTQDNTLNVHHLYYIKDSLAWQYPNNALITLCERCHCKWHEVNILEVREKVWGKRRGYKVKKKKKGVVLRVIKPKYRKRISLAESQIEGRHRKRVNGNWQVC
jgi:hypothetical protein